MKLARATILAALLCPPAPCAADQKFAVDEARSSVEVGVRAMIDSVTARFTDFDADLSVPGGNIGGVSGQVHFVLANLKTGNDERDAQMYNWLQEGSFPNGDLSIASLAPDGRGNFAASGRLKFHGTEGAASFPVKIKLEQGILTVEGDTSLDTRDYGLPIYRRFLILTVDPVVHVRFRVTGRLPPQ